VTSDFDDIFDALSFSVREREIFLECISSIRAASDDDSDAISLVVAKVKELTSNEV